MAPPSGAAPGGAGRIPTPLPRRPSASGPVLFARYAFGPNRLGLCGPEDWRSLLELGAEGLLREPGSGGATPRRRADEIDKGLRNLATGFEAAFPYLELIARSSRIADALDPRVVDAYWIGNTLSDSVDPALMRRSLDARFRRQLDARAWRWLAAKPAAGAHPTHAFHVFDVFPRVGLMRGGAVADAVGLLDSCRIRWGRVIEVSGSELVVDAVPLELIEGRLRFGAARPQRVRRWLDGAGFVSDVVAGDTVSLHWDWACEVLSEGRLAALQRRTRYQLELANQTL